MNSWTLSLQTQRATFKAPNSEADDPYDNQRSVEYFGPTVCASPPPEIYKPSEISEAFQEVVFTELIKVVPEAGLEPARF